MTNSMSGKVCVVTGATSGIGRAMARELAGLGATVVLVARDRARGEAVREAIARETGNAAIELLHADLASLASIRAGVAEFKTRHDTVHVLVNQAGLVERDRTVTPEGFETMFMVNYLAYFALFHGLLDLLRAGAPSRVLNVTGGIEAAGEIRFDDLQSERAFSWFKTLAQSKLADVLFTYEAARRYSAQGIAVNALNPGGVRTNLGKNTRGLPRLLMSFVGLMAPTPEKVAGRFVRLVSAPEFEGVTGKFFGPDAKAPARSSPRSHDEAVAKRLWDVSAQLAGVAG